MRATGSTTTETRAKNGTGGKVGEKTTEAATRADGRGEAPRFFPAAGEHAPTEHGHKTKRRRPQKLPWKRRRRTVHRFIFGDKKHNGALFLSGSPPKTESLSRKATRAIACLVLVVVINVVGAYVFNAIELKKELKLRRKQRVELRRRMTLFLVRSNMTHPHQVERVMHLYGAGNTFNTASGEDYIKKLGCGACYDRGAWSHLAGDSEHLVNEALAVAVPVLEMLDWDPSDDERVKAAFESHIRSSNASTENEADETAVCRDNTYLHKCDWRYVSAFFFTMTIMTSIGYGSFTPRTTAGKVAVVVFTAVGLFVISRAIQAIGDLVKARVDLNRRQLKERRLHVIAVSENDATTDKKYRFDQHILKLAVVVVLAYLAVGGFVFKRTEQWAYWDAVYFAFGTLSTVGLGDFVPSTSITHLLPAWLYIFFGLAIVSFFSAALARVETDFLSRSHSLPRLVHRPHYSRSSSSLLRSISSRSIQFEYTPSTATLSDDYTPRTRGLTSSSPVVLDRRTSFSTS